MNTRGAITAARDWLGNVAAAVAGRGARVDGFGGAVAGPNATGMPVTPGRALSLTACYAAINVLSRDLASLPLSSWQTLEGGRTQELIGDRRRELLHVTPDGERTAYRFRQSLLSHALTYGNGYAEIERYDRDGSPAALHLLDPTKIRAERSKQTGLLWYVQDGGPKLAAENVVHIAPLGFDGLTGYSPIKLAMQAVALGLAAETFGAAFFGNGSTPKGVIHHPKRMTPEAATRLREGFERIHGSPLNAHRVAVLEEGAEWQQTTIPPEEAQFILTRQFQVIEIARLYGLPPHKIGDYSQAHLATVEESNLDYLATSLRGWCIAIESELNLKLFTAADRAAGLFARHNMADLMRGNSTARAAFYQVLLQTGALTPNQIAAAEGLEPIGAAGDCHLVPMNLTTLEAIGRNGDELAQRVAAIILEFHAKHGTTPGGTDASAKQAA